MKFVRHCYGDAEVKNAWSCVFYTDYLLWWRITKILS